jgi:type VI secretion system protein ImpK
MDVSNDPFGLLDSDLTQLARPVPGGRPARAAAPPAPPPARPRYRAGGAGIVLGTPGRGPLVQCAFGLLSLVPLLRTRTPPAAPEHLRTRIEDELRAFAERAQANGIDQRLVALGHYALCALLDDVVLNTPWGAHGTWRANSLAGALHHDAAAGERFFAYLDQAMREPERSRPVLELMAACLALGFEGRYRIAPQGQAALPQLRRDLFGMLHRLDGEDDGSLSPQWRGVDATHVPVARRIPLWVFASGALAVLVLAYAALAVRLGAEAGRLDAVIAALPPSAPASIDRPAADAPAPAPVPARAALEPRLRACLAEAGRTEPEAVSETLLGLRIRLPDAGLFASGSAKIQAAVQPRIACIAEILKGTEGRVAVVGHTDNLPIRRPAFASNWELSKARAEAVAALLRPVLGAGRLQATGRADTEPLLPNDTEEGRNRNRRVEILLAR